jgi:cell fate regulator YaaT (PSP1 superfamily)
MEVSEKHIQKPLKAVLRLSTREDDERMESNRVREREAFRICREKIQRRGLEMKLIDAEYTFDNSKILFYFTADGRVDFRELVRDLAGVFRTRIELRQIGVRDETKIIGGYGICGRKLCCQAYLSDFVPVSIKMAKEQNLSLNPTKISGACGRLMCCLKYEEETYEELNKNLPRQGDEVRGSDGLVGEVESVNVLRQTVRILVEVDNEKEYHEYGVDDITIVRRRRRGQARQARKEKKENSSREMKELQKLEHEDKKSGKSRLRE